MTADFTARKINIGDSDYPAEYNQLIDDIEAEINTTKRISQRPILTSRRDRYAKIT